jgi:hypothetical protein
MAITPSSKWQRRPQDYHPYCLAITTRVQWRNQRRCRWTTHSSPYILDCLQNTNYTRSHPRQCPHPWIPSRIRIHTVAIRPTCKTTLGGGLNKCKWNRHTTTRPRQPLDVFGTLPHIASTGSTLLEIAAHTLSLKRLAR